MNTRERVMAILNYKEYDRIPLVHFGYWRETIEKWYNEGHITCEDYNSFAGDGSKGELSISSKLGFDMNWSPIFNADYFLFPSFEPKIIENLPDGSFKKLNKDGVVLLEKPGIVSIPQEFEHLLKDRESWEEHYLPRLKFSKERINNERFEAIKAECANSDKPIGIFCGSLFGEIRNWLGVEGSCYLYADDEDLFGEIIDTVANLIYEILENILNKGFKFDYAHFWEDICFKNGPLINPSVFDEKVGPHYKRITSLLNQHGINLISLDCDGLIDSLIPTWLENGVNTMFPIEVGTWEASIEPWRNKYGTQIRGVGGMNKNVFAKDFAAIDEEIERLKKLINLGGYIPCPDHRIPPDAKWENVAYYCEKMKNL